MPRPEAMTPVWYCSNEKVQAFIEAEAWDIGGPYRQPQFVKTAQQVFDEARARFGDLACCDLRMLLH